jgi:hypothetical protein
MVPAMGRRVAEHEGHPTNKNVFVRLRHALLSLDFLLAINAYRAYWARFGIRGIFPVKNKVGGNEYAGRAALRGQPGDMLRGLDIYTPGPVRVQLAIVRVRRGGRVYHRNRTDFFKESFYCREVAQVKPEHGKRGVMHFMGPADADHLPIVFRGIANVPSQKPARPRYDKLFHAIKIQDRDAFSKVNSPRHIRSNLILCILLIYSFFKKERKRL